MQAGSGPMAALRTVESEDPGQPDPQPVPTVVIGNLVDLSDLASRHRDVKMKAMIRKYLRPVKIEPGRLEIALHDEAPRSLVGELDGKLKAWTGSRWIIAISRERGGKTIEEMEAEHRAELVQDASHDPDVAAILNQFPGARIRDVRIRADDTDPPVASQSDDGDILPDDTDE